MITRFSLGLHWLAISSARQSLSRRLPSIQDMDNACVNGRRGEGGEERRERFLMFKRDFFGRFLFSFQVTVMIGDDKWRLM